MSGQFDTFRQDARRWGVAKSVLLRTMRRLERFLAFRLFIVHSRELNPNASQVDVPTGCAARLMTEQELIAFSCDPALGLAKVSIRKATGRGDVCFGYLENDALVAYVWIGTQPTPAEDGLWARFGEGYAYGYKALTLPTHRGRHLQETLIRQAERWRTSHGHRYHIGYVHVLNLASTTAATAHSDVDRLQNADISGSTRMSQARTPVLFLLALLVASATPHAPPTVLGSYESEVEDGENGMKYCFFSNGTKLSLHWNAECPLEVAD